METIAFVILGLLLLSGVMVFGLNLASGFLLNAASTVTDHGKQTWLPGHRIRGRP